MKILIATLNENKIKEIKKAFKNTNFELLSLKDFNDNSDVNEIGKTFKQNALIKAKYYALKHKITTIADDSGLVVKALNGRPGIHSKRYAGNDKLNNEKLLEELSNKKSRKAKMITVLCIYNFETEKINYFKGVLKVEIAKDLKGNNGFGYDPLLYIKEINKTLGELTNEEKTNISHRGKAIKKVKKYYENISNK